MKVIKQGKRTKGRKDDVARRRSSFSIYRILQSRCTGAAFSPSPSLVSYNNYAFRYISAKRGRTRGETGNNTARTARPLVLVYFFYFILFFCDYTLCTATRAVRQAVTKRSNCENLLGRQYKIGIIKGALKILIYRFNVARARCVSVVFTIFPVDFYDHRVSRPPQSGSRRITTITPLPARLRI